VSATAPAEPAGGDPTRSATAEELFAYIDDDLGVR
jgi:hypothetical protein